MKENEMYESNNEWNLEEDVIKYLADELNKYECQPKVSFPNPQQISKYKRVLEYFRDLAENDFVGEVTTDLNPNCPCGFIEVHLFSLNIQNKDKEKFLDILSDIDVFSVDGVNEGKIKIGININNCFIQYVGK